MGSGRAVRRFCGSVPEPVAAAEAEAQDPALLAFMVAAPGDLVTVASSGDFGKPRPALVVQADLFQETGTLTVWSGRPRSGRP